MDKIKSDKCHSSLTPLISSVPHPHPFPTGATPRHHRSSSSNSSSHRPAAGAARAGQQQEQPALPAAGGHAGASISTGAASIPTHCPSPLIQEKIRTSRLPGLGHILELISPIPWNNGSPNNSNSDLKLRIIPTRQFERTIELLVRSNLSNHHNSTPAATSSTQFLSPENSLRVVSTEKWNSSKRGIIGPSFDPYLLKYKVWLHNQVYSAIPHYPSFLQKLNCCARMGVSLQFHFFSCNILLKGINSTELSDKLNVTSAPKHSKKQGELSLTISDATDQKKVQKAGKVEHHLWKKRESAGSGQKALNLVRIISGLPNEKESVYGALDKWIAWEIEFPLIAAAKALRILRQQRLWKRVIQVAKWMLSKGQGATMATYDALLLAFDMDNRVDEAERLWNMILHTSTRSVSKRLFSRMISLYDHHHVPDKIVEVFADMEELGVKPDEDTVRRVARAFQMLGQEDNQKLVLKKYQSRWKYVHFNGERARVRRRDME